MKTLPRAQTSRKKRITIYAPSISRHGKTNTERRIALARTLFFS
jgi:hypothetical protein